jgi:hypothetical protein
MTDIWINVWQWSKDPSKKVVLYDGQIPFAASPTFSREWRVAFSFQARNPLATPVPQNQELFYAYHEKAFPYAVVDIYPVVNALQTKQTGTYFIAYTSSLPGTYELPWNNVYVRAIQYNRL